MEKLSKEEALAKLSDGHTIWKPEMARRICEALGVDYNPSLERPFFSEPGVFKGAEIPPENEGKLGVSGIALGSHVARKLGVENRVTAFLGRGRQGHEYARVVGEALKEHSH